MTYEPVIGFETHVELLTRSKCFCGCSTRFNAPPNTQVCPVCLGMPGVLPVLNKRAVELTLRSAIALHCQVTRNCQFERKNYYYPDLPKNYQISQLRTNLGVDGWLDIPVNGGVKRIGIDNVHLEEDAGKLIHPENAGSEDYSLVDLNRAGTPLMEIVTRPDLRSIDEAMAFMQTLRNILQYLEVSDCKMQEGRLRFEVNISLRPAGAGELRTKVEIKNLNSMRTAIRTIEHEIKRQTRIYEAGGTVDQETRLWDEAAGVTRAMRSKEFAHDYRYFPEPDLPWLEITQSQYEDVKNHLPELAEARRARFIDQFALSEYDAGVLTSSKPMADYFESALAEHNNPKALSNWIQTELLGKLNQRDLDIEDSPIAPRHLGRLVGLIDDNTISGKIAKTVFAEMFDSGAAPDDIIQQKGLVQVTDTGEIEAWVNDALAANPAAVEQFKSGKEKAIGALVGHVMKVSKGKANPQLVNELLRRKLA